MNEEQGAKFGINFYDPIDYESADVQYTGEEISRSVLLAADNFPLIRTISDFNAGDPGQYVGSAYQPIPGTPINNRNSAWQEALRSTELDVILTIEHPKKWLSSVDMAVSYIYQYVLPLMKDVELPNSPKYQPSYYGTKPINPEVQFFNVKDHIKAISVGLEVGTHLNLSMPEGQFASKADIVSNLPLYVDNLIQALTIFGLDNKIQVTTSFAPSNANKSAAELAKEGIYEFIIQQDGKYSLNNNSYEIDGVTINFGNVIDAINIIASKQIANATGILLSVYSYWQYQPGTDFESKTANDWAQSTSIRYAAITEPFENVNCGVGEIGWPTGGDNSIDGAPNKPSKSVCENLYKGLLLWARGSGGLTNAPKNINIWQLTDAEEDSSVEDNNPENNYGFYYKGLKSETNKMKFPALKGMFKDGNQADKRCNHSNKR